LCARRVHGSVGVDEAEGTDEGFGGGVDLPAGFAPGDAGRALVRRGQGVLEIGLQVLADVVALLLREGEGERGGERHGNQAVAC
jgi:hypothetical protein